MNEKKRKKKPLYIANISKCHNRESRVTGRAAKVAKVVINPVSQIGPRESPYIPNWICGSVANASPVSENGKNLNWRFKPEISEKLSHTQFLHLITNHMKTAGESF